MDIKGIVVSGHGIASGQAMNSPYPRGSLEIQFPFFKDAGLDLCVFYKGTINLDISPLKWKPIEADYTFEHIAWFDSINPETFSFIKCTIRYREVELPGWIYYPHPETKPDHFQSPSVIEVITYELRGLQHGDHVLLMVDDHKMHLY